MGISPLAKGENEDRSETRWKGIVSSTWAQNDWFCNINPDNGGEALRASFADIEDNGVAGLKEDRKVSFISWDTMAGPLARELKLEADF